MSTNAQPRLLLSFVRLRLADLLMFGRHVVTSLTGNASFPTLNPTLAVVTTSLDAFEAADDAAMGGGKVPVAARQAAKLDTLILLRQLVTSVENQANGDRVALTSSGFALSKERSKVGDLPPPEPPLVDQGLNPGAIKSRINKPRGASSTIWRIALESAPTVYLETVSTPGGRYTFTGLTAGSVYLIQAAVVGAAGQTGWSPTSALMAL